VSAVVRYAEDVDETGEPIWSLGLRCGHSVTYSRFSECPPTQRPCVTCKQRQKWRRKDQRKRERKAAGVNKPFVFRLRNG
jgi:hypothetical protein